MVHTVALEKHSVCARPCRGTVPLHLVGTMADISLGFRVKGLGFRVREEVESAQEGGRVASFLRSPVSVKTCACMHNANNTSHTNNASISNSTNNTNSTNDINSTTKTNNTNSIRIILITLIILMIRTIPRILTR